MRIIATFIHWLKTKTSDEKATTPKMQGVKTKTSDEK
jgi:hypothetical protein